MSWKIIHLGSWNLDIPCVTTIHEGPRGVRTVFSRLPKLRQRRGSSSEDTMIFMFITGLELFSVRNTCCLFVKTNPFTKMAQLEAKWYYLVSRWVCFHFGFRKNGNERFFMYTCGQTLGHRQTPKITEYKNGHTMEWHSETVDLSTWKQLCRETTSSNHSKIQHLFLLVEFFWIFGRHFVESLGFFLVAVYMEKLPWKSIDWKLFLVFTAFCLYF